jgi:hypothetical protein
MNIANSKSVLPNNSFTSDIQEKICNCLGCYRFADIKVALKIGKNQLQYLSVVNVNINLKRVEAIFGTNRYYNKLSKIYMEF